MADSYLNKSGLSYFWTKIKNALSLKTDKTDFDLVDRYYRALVPVGTEITSNKNLDTVEFLSVGKYYCHNNATAATLTNCPTGGRAFMMEVFSPLSTTIDNETTGTWVYRTRIITTYEGKTWYQSCYSNDTAGNWIYGSWKYMPNSGDVDNQIYANTNSKYGRVQCNTYTADSGKWVKIASMSHHTCSYDNISYTFRLDFVGAGTAEYRKSYTFGVGARMSDTNLSSVRFHYLDSEKFYYNNAPEFENLVKVTRKWVAGSSSADHYIYFEIWVHLLSGWKTYWLHPTNMNYKGDYGVSQAFFRNGDEWTYSNVSGPSATIGQETYLTDGYEEVPMEDVRNGVSYLDPIFTTRQTTADAPEINGRGGIRTFVATSSMSDRPADGNILHLDWDNTGGWDSQLMVSHADSIGPNIYARGMSNGTWGDWVRFVRNGDSATFNNIKLDRVNTYPHIGGDGTYLAFSVDGLWGQGHGSIALKSDSLYPSTTESGLINLGESGRLWKNLYLSDNIYKGDYVLTLPNKTGTVALTSDIPTTMVGATDSSGGSSGLVPVPSAGDNIKYLSGDGTWSIPSSTYSSFLGSSPGTAGYWKKLGNLTFPQHQQGKSVLLKIILGFGNNGTNAQQAFVDLIGQLGWTGSYSGRAGWTASYNKMNTGKPVNNFDIKVIANSVLDYDVYIRAAGTYMSVTPVFIPGINNDGTENAIWTPDYSNWTQDAPTGTECDIAFKTAALTDDLPTKVSDLTSDVGGNVFVGTCATAAATAAKAVTISADQNFALQAGVMIVAKFTYTNSANNPTINVNNTGAKSIWYNTGLITTGNLNKAGYANRFCYFVYDGTNWVWINWSVDGDTTYSTMSVAEGQAGTATSQRVVRADYLKQIIQSYVPTTYDGSLITDGSITFDKTASGEFLKLETSTTDPGEGSVLDDNTLLAVYDVPDDYRRGEILVSTQNVDTLATTSNVAAVWSAGTWTQFGRMASSSNKHILTIENPTSNNWTVEISLDCPSVLPGSVISGSSVITTTPATGIAELDSSNAISKVITWSRIASRGSVYNRKYVTIPANSTKKFCACICTYQNTSTPTGIWEGGDEISGTAVGAGFGGASCTLTATLIDNGE